MAFFGAGGEAATYFPRARRLAFFGAAASGEVGSAGVDSAFLARRVGRVFGFPDEVAKGHPEIRTGAGREGVCGLLKWAHQPFALWIDFPMTALSLTLVRPDDWHLHVRDGAALAAVVPDTARRFGRALIMPNLKPPVTSVEQAAAYRQRILAAVPEGLKFAPLMTLYLTDTLRPDEIDKAAASGFML